MACESQNTQGLSIAYSSASAFDNINSTMLRLTISLYKNRNYKSTQELARYIAPI